MNIAINTRFLLPNKPLEGLGRFTNEICFYLVKNNPEHTFYFYFDRPFDKKYIFGDNVVPVIIGPQARHAFLFIVWFEMQIPKYLKKHKIDVFFSPDNFMSLRTNCPTVLAIHDLYYLHKPEHINLSARLYYQFFMGKFIKKASHIIAVSNFVRDDVFKNYGISEKNMSVAYNALPSSFTKRIVKNEVKKYFILTGSIHPRKNLYNTLLAFSHFVKEFNDYKILVIGRIVGNMSTELSQLWNALVDKGVVIHEYNISDELLIEKISSSTALLYVSKFEGFGIPILEGMACGVPVITSNITSMPEVAGNAAFLANPFDVEDIKNKMIEVVTNHDLVQEKIKLGYQRINDFSYEKSAEVIWSAILKIYKDKN